MFWLCDAMANSCVATAIVASDEYIRSLLAVDFACTLVCVEIKELRM